MVWFLHGKHCAKVVCVAFFAHARSNDSFFNCNFWPPPPQILRHFKILRAVIKINDPVQTYFTHFLIVSASFSSLQLCYLQEVECTWELATAVRTMAHSETQTGYVYVNTCEGLQAKNHRVMTQCAACLSAVCTVTKAVLLSWQQHYWNFAAVSLHHH